MKVLIDFIEYLFMARDGRMLPNAEGAGTAGAGQRPREAKMRASPHGSTNRMLFLLSCTVLIAALDPDIAPAWAFCPLPAALQVRGQSLY